jgi:hypothetical protein
MNTLSKIIIPKTIFTYDLLGTVHYASPGKLSQMIWIDRKNGKTTLKETLTESRLLAPKYEVVYFYLTKDARCASDLIELLFLRFQCRVPKDTSLDNCFEFMTTFLKQRLEKRKRPVLMFFDNCNAAKPEVHESLINMISGLPNKCVLIYRPSPILAIVEQTQ